MSVCKAFEFITREEALKLVGYRHACHAMFHAPCKEVLFGSYPVRHAVMVRIFLFCLYVMGKKCTSSIIDRGTFHQTHSRSLNGSRMTLQTGSDIIQIS